MGLVVIMRKVVDAQRMAEGLPHRGLGQTNVQHCKPSIAA